MKGEGEERLLQRLKALHDDLPEHQGRLQRTKKTEMKVENRQQKRTARGDNDVKVKPLFPGRKKPKTEAEDQLPKGKAPGRAPAHPRNEIGRKKGQATVAKPKEDGVKHKN